MKPKHDPDTAAWLKACVEITARRGPHNADGTMSSGVCAAILARYDSLKVEAFASHHEARVAEGLPVGDDPNDTVKMLTSPREWHAEREASAQPETKAMSNMEAVIADQMSETPKRIQPKLSAAEAEAEVKRQMGLVTPKAPTPAPKAAPKPSAQDERAAFAKLSDEERTVMRLMGATASSMIKARSVTVAR